MSTKELFYGMEEEPLSELETRQDLLAGLNEDLSAEWGTIIRYTYQAGKSFGLMGIELRELLEKEAQDELGHAAFLTDVIIDLGGEPNTSPREFAKPANLKAMLELDLEMEQQDVTHYIKHAKVAGELGLHELQMKLDEMAADEAGHARVLRRILKGL